MSMVFDVDPGFQMWVIFALIVGALVFYVFERASMELTSIGIVCFLLLFFHFFPVQSDSNSNIMGPVRILQGFANPALVTVLALLVMGGGLVRSGALDRGAGFILSLSSSKAGLMIALFVALFVTITVSAFLNNIPVVVIFIPIMQALAARSNMSASKFMIPLSYAAVLGGMTTLIGSSTNLLVNSALIEMGATPFQFFDFTIPGLIMAFFGLIYVMWGAPKLLPDRAGLADKMATGSGKQFIVEMTVGHESSLIGNEAKLGMLSRLPDKTLRSILRDEEVFVPPFEGYVVQAGDVIVVAATRKELVKTLTGDAVSLLPNLSDETSPDKFDEKSGRWHEGEQVVAEVMVAPGSELVGKNLPNIGFHHRTHCAVLGIQRRSRMMRQALANITLEAGDVLLIQGQAEDVSSLKLNRGVILLEWSAEDLSVLKGAKRSGAIFLIVVALSASGLVPIVISALCGAAAMVMTGVLNVRQAFQAVDPKIITTIAAALALGVALQETGGANYIAEHLANALKGASIPVVLSCFFLLVAVLSNVISTKTCAVLFTPISIDLAAQLGVSHVPFAVAVIFAANCSFASPLGYQTNLLVMGPGHYKFTDYSRAGIPLIIILWVVFSLFAPWYYDI